MAQKSRRSFSVAADFKFYLLIVFSPENYRSTAAITSLTRPKLLFEVDAGPPHDGVRRKGGPIFRALLRDRAAASAVSALHRPREDTILPRQNSSNALLTRYQATGAD
jgi:hypothetical protein